MWEFVSNYYIDGFHQKALLRKGGHSLLDNDNNTEIIVMIRRYQIMYMSVVQHLLI